MSDMTFKDDCNRRVFTIHSQKGGVGKTSIALALAGISCAWGKKSLIIDADMTGASLADIPGVGGVRGTNKKWFNQLILATPKQFESVTTIFKTHSTKEGDLEKQFCQKIKDYESGFFIPSSSEPEHVAAVVPLISQEDHLHFFRHRIEDIIVAAILEGFEMIIIDHSPGIFGFSKTSLEMTLEWAIQQNGINNRLRTLLNASNKDVASKVLMQAILVSSYEPHDYRALLPSFSYVLETKSDKTNWNQWFSNSFRLVFNRTPEVSDTLDAINPIIENLKGFPDELKQMITEQEKEFGTQLAPLIAGFGMGDILLKAKAFAIKDQVGGDSGGEWRKWFKALACRACLYNQLSIH